jgi:predicted nuclease of predicted toxin-antitoxin system
VSLKLYMDHHVPEAVTKALRRRGIDVITALEDGREKVDDEELLNRSTQLARILYTQDQDYLGIADRRRKEGRDFSGIVYAHQQSISLGRAIADLELVVQVLEAEQMQNQVQFLPL